MFLIKCKCGCFFTVKKENLNYSYPSCPNCSARIPLNKDTELGNSHELCNATESVSYIPDNAKVTVTFDT